MIGMLEPSHRASEFIKRLHADFTHGERPDVLARVLATYVLLEKQGLQKQSVYFVRAGDEGPIKIGTSRSVMSRVRNLQCACPDRLCLLLEIPGDKVLEEILHFRFRRLRLNGEWFNPRLELLEFIRHASAVTDRIRTLAA